MGILGIFVEPRWGSVVEVIGNPAWAARRWALEFNAVGVKARCLTATPPRPASGNRLSQSRQERKEMKKQEIGKIATKGTKRRPQAPIRN